MSKHTKGHWEAVPSEEFNSGFDVMSEEYFVASTHNGVHGEDNEEANARLIAAAPELLEALEAALEWIDTVPRDTVLPTMPGFDRDWVNEVIDKTKRADQIKGGE